MTSRRLEQKGKSNLKEDRVIDEKSQTKQKQNKKGGAGGAGHSS